MVVIWFACVWRRSAALHVSTAPDLPATTDPVGHDAVLCRGRSDTAHHLAQGNLAATAAAADDDDGDAG